METASKTAKRACVDTTTVTLVTYLRNTLQNCTTNYLKFCLQDKASLLCIKNQEDFIFFVYIEGSPNQVLKACKWTNNICPPYMHATFGHSFFSPTYALAPAKIRGGGATGLKPPPRRGLKLHYLNQHKTYGKKCLHKFSFSNARYLQASSPL